MSLPAKLTLGGAVGLTLGIVGYVHITQYIDRNRLHEGVIKDVERQKRRKMENIYTLQKQADLTKQLRNELEIKNHAASDSG